MNQAISSPEWTEKQREIQSSQDRESGIQKESVETKKTEDDESYTEEEVDENSIADSTDDCEDSVYTESTDAALSIEGAIDGIRSKMEHVDLNDLRQKKVQPLLEGNTADEEAEDEPEDLVPTIDHKRIDWEKPDWVKERKLKAHEKSETLKEKGDLQNPITKIAEANQYEWQKPDWAKEKNLRSHEKSDVMKAKGDLQAPITRATIERDDLDYLNFEANPMRLKPTDKGFAVRLGENLAKPITHIERDPMGDVNFEAAPTLVLKQTELGQQVKSGVSLAAPVTFPIKEFCDANFDANPALLKPTLQGSVLKSGKDISRPITFPNGKE